MVCLSNNSADAEKAIAACDGTELDGRTIEVKVSLPRGSKAPSRKSKSELLTYTIMFYFTLVSNTTNCSILLLSFKSY